jgi:nucleotide-binding universal stress UspA family protein
MDRTILVGVDASSACQAAIRWSIERAASTGSDVVLLHVIDDEWGVIGEQFGDELDPDAKRLLEERARFARGVDPSVRVTTRLAVGDPMVELAAASGDVGLVAIGTHKTGYLRGRAFGPRALQLAATSHAPLAVIPEASSAVRRGIIAGVDDSPAGCAAVAFAADEACRVEQELVLLRAWRLPASGTRTAEDSAQERARHSVARLVDSALLLAKGGRAQLRVRSRSVHRAPAEALVDAGASAELLVIGSSRHHGGQTSGLGPVSHDVLLNIAGPTLIVHGDSATPDPGLALTMSVGRPDA